MIDSAVYSRPGSRDTPVFSSAGGGVILDRWNSFYKLLRACHNLYMDIIHKMDCGLLKLTTDLSFMLENVVT